MVFTNEEIITFLKPYSQYIGWSVLIAIIIILAYFRFRKKKPKQQDSLIDAYNASKKRGRPRKQEKIAEIMEEEPPMDSMESILEKDMEKWKGFEKQLDVRRGEILHLNTELEEELARIDAWKRFIKDVFSKVGRKKDEN